MPANRQFKICIFVLFVLLLFCLPIEFVHLNLRKKFFERKTIREEISLTLCEKRVLFDDTSRQFIMNTEKSKKH